MKRRDFMKGVLGAAGLGAVGWRVFAQDRKDEGGANESPVAPITSRADAAPFERRALGRTGFQATLLAFGGYPISEVGEKQALGAVEAALEEGVNYFDTASTYGDHKSEGYLSKVLPHQKRESFFLTTKTLQRTRAAAEKEIARSLRTLKVQPDLLQVHAVNDMSSLESAMGKGGSFEAALAAKEAGHVKFLGITGHTRPEVIDRALDLYPFDTVLIPLGAADAHVRSFIPVIAKAKEKGAAVIGMKVLSGGHAAGKVPLEGLFHYTWSLEIATAVIGMRTRDEVRTAAAAARSFKPLGEEQLAAIVEKAKPLGTPDVLWWKKV